VIFGDRVGGGGHRFLHDLLHRLVDLRARHLDLFLNLGQLRQRPAGSPTVTPNRTVDERTAGSAGRGDEGSRARAESFGARRDPVGREELTEQRVAHRTLSLVTGSPVSVGMPFLAGPGWSLVDGIGGAAFGRDPTQTVEAEAARLFVALFEVGR